ncbi:MAG: DUF418 domain-containing protein [Planctomycetota bacterium]
MNAQEPALSRAPVALSQRLESLDVLRGIALLGIFVPNLLAMAFPSSTLVFPWETFPEPTAADEWSMAAIGVFFHGKFIFLFSIMFGVGARVFADGKGDRSTGLWFRRMGFLFALGVLHGSLLFFGDILTSYAFAGVVVVWWCRRLKATTLLILSAALVFVGLVMYLLAMAGWGYQVREEGLQASQGYDPASEIATVQAGGLDAAMRRLFAYAQFQLIFMPLIFLPLLSGFMLLGMALMRSGFFAGVLGAKREILLAVLGLGLGVPASAAAHWWLIGGGPIAQASFLAVGQALAIPVGLGYAALVLLWVRTGVARPVRNALASVGRMALTNYLLQSVLAVLLFDAIGLGLFGKVSLPEVFLFAGGVWTVLITWSVIWSRWFSRGPLEALWRTFTYGKTRGPSGVS